MDLISIIMIAILIEAVVQILKPLWDKAATALTVPEIVSMVIGVLIAILAKINLLNGLVTVTSPILLYIFYTLTGIAIGRGPSFVHDLWLKLRSGYGNELLPLLDDTNDSKKK